MATLHLVFSADGYRTCLQRLAEGDVVVLLQDGVYAQSIRPGTSVLSDDVMARGMANYLTQTTPVEWADIVRLTETHQPIVSWR